MDFDNSDMAPSAAYSPDGTLAFFASLGSSLLTAVDVFDTGDVFTISTVGDAPLGMAIDPTRNNLFVHNFMSRSVAVLGTDGLINGTDNAVRTLGNIGTVANETLLPNVLTGKKIFYDTKDGRITSEGYMSCATCHFDGGHDGRIWDITNMVRCGLLAGAIQCLTNQSTFRPEPWFD